MASPLMVLATAAQHTERIRLGTAVTLLPLHSPMKMAEEAATADILSGGRLEFGVGRGTAPVHYQGYNVPMEESRERFAEALDVIRTAWTTDRLSYQGKYFQAEDLPVVPRPIQQPYPPIRMAANSPDTFALAAQLGLSIFASPLINPPDKLRDYIAEYQRNLEPGVRPDVALMFPVHVADSRAKAREEYEPEPDEFFPSRRRTAPSARQDHHQKLRSLPTDSGALGAGQLRGIGQQDGAFGDPDYCIERIRHFKQEFPMTEFIGLFQPGRSG